MKRDCNIREGDLANLTGVRDLYLYGNEISELPDGFFKDAGSFDRVLMQDNPGAPFMLDVILTERPSGSYVVQMREGTPFRVDVTLKATGASLYPRVTDIYGGDIQSIESTVTADGSGETVRVEIDQVSFRDWGLTGYSYYDGFELGIASETASAPATPRRHRGSDGSSRSARRPTDHSAHARSRAGRTDQPHGHRLGRVDHPELDRAGRRRRDGLPDPAPPAH